MTTNDEINKIINESRKYKIEFYKTNSCMNKFENFCAFYIDKLSDICEELEETTVAICTRVGILLMFLSIVLGTFMLCLHCYKIFAFCAVFFAILLVFVIFTRKSYFIAEKKQMREFLEKRQMLMSKNV